MRWVRRIRGMLDDCLVGKWIRKTEGLLLALDSLNRVVVVAFVSDERTIGGKKLGITLYLNHIVVGIDAGDPENRL